jgi:uncharacterized RmlC-like cupin family protein
MAVRLQITPPHASERARIYVRDRRRTDFDIDGIGTKDVKAGEVLYAPPNTPHFGHNATDKISSTRVLRIKDTDKPIMVEVKRNTHSTRQ